MSPLISNNFRNEMKNENSPKKNVEGEAHLWRGFGESVILTRLPNLFDVIKIASGQNHSLILTRSGDVFSTGNNSYGQLGNGIRSDTIETPLKIATIHEKCVDIACGSHHSAAVDKNGHIYVWGNNENSQCAVENAQFVLIPTVVTFPQFTEHCVHGYKKTLPELRVARVSCGESHTVVLTSEREIWTWGHGPAMGLLSTSHTVKPQRLDFLRGRNIISISCGGYHTVALLSSIVIEELGEMKETVENEHFSCPLCNPHSGDDEPNEFGRCPLGLPLKKEPNVEEEEIESVRNVEDENSVANLNSSVEENVSNQTEQLKDETTLVQKRKSAPPFIDTQSAKEFLAQRLSSITSVISPGISSTSKDPAFVYEAATDAIRQNVSVLTNMVVSGVKNTVDKFGFVSKQFSRDYDSASGTSVDLDEDNSSVGTDFEVLDEASITQHPFLLNLAYTCRRGIESRAKSLRSEAKRKLSRSSRCGSLDASLHATDVDGESISCRLQNPVKNNPLMSTEVWTWGRGNMGQLGQGDGMERVQPCCINILKCKGVIKVDAGSCHTVALTAGGQVYVWGYNSHGQLGNPNRTNPGYSPQILNLESSAVVWDVAAGNKHTVLLADRGLNTEIYYCGKQEGPLVGVEVDGPVPLSGAIGTNTPEIISISGCDSNVRQVFAGGLSCGCISDNTLPSTAITIRELCAAERCFYQTLTLFKDTVLDPLCNDSSYSTIMASSLGVSVEALVTHFKRLWHQVALNNLTLGVTMRLPPMQSSVSQLVDNLDDWVAAFENYAAVYLDLYACDGLSFCAKTASSFFSKTQPFKEDKCIVDVLARFLEEPFRRMFEYQRSFDVLAAQYKQMSIANFRETEVSKCFATLTAIFQREKVVADKTRQFWENCSQKLADNIRTPHRRLLHESKTNPLILSGSGRFSSNWFILLNDVLIHSQFSSYTEYTLPLIWVDILSDTDILQNAFTMMMPEETLTVSCPNTQEKTEWICALNQAIRASLAKTKGSTRRLHHSMNAGDQRLSAALNRTGTYKFVKKSHLQSATYTGTWLCAKLHGQGELTWPDGRKFVGKFKQNIQCGDGLYVVPSDEGNTISDGMWQDGKMNGLGSIRYPNKDLYEGYFKDGMCHGHGVFKKGQFMTSAASMYIGEWAFGHKNGYGVMDEIITGEKYMGLWQDDQRHGNGLVVTLDGVYYEGMFAQNKMMGHGLVIFEDDSWYEGEFNGAAGFGGKGTLTFASGDKIEGNFTGSRSEGIKVNGTLHKATANQNHDSTKPAFFASLCVSADQKWTDIFRHCYQVFGVDENHTIDSSELTQRVWETVAAVVSKWRERLSRSSAKGCSVVQDLDGLDRIPQIVKDERLTLEKYREIQTYLNKAFSCSYHPLGKLMEGLVDVYRATYIGVGAHPRLLTHAVAEVNSFIQRVYRIVCILFPNLPPNGQEMKVKPATVVITDDSDDEEEVEVDVVTPSGLVLPYLLPQIYPPLFTLYALHNEKDDDRYWQTLLKWNRQSDLSLMAFLGVENKFWFTGNDEPRKMLSSIKDEHFSKAVDMLQHLSTTFSPEEKLKVIYKTFQEITKEVQSCLGEEFIWTMDDLFPVFQYVVVRARIRHLGSEVLLIDDLMETHLQHGELGIMFTTLKACYFQVKKEQNMMMKFGYSLVAFCCIGCFIKSNALRISPRLLPFFCSPLNFLRAASSSTSPSIKPRNMPSANVKPFEHLPKTVIPKHYAITLQPDLIKFTTFGKQTVQLDVVESVDKIVLNSLDVTIESVEVKTANGTVVEHTSTEIDAENEIATLRFASAIPLGKAELNMKFVSILNDKLKGLYRSQYATPTGETRYAAVTQFEPTYARYAFPCWDEPALKATFDITMVVPNDRVALSNMNVISDTPLDGDTDLRVVKFATTPIMSTYLVACIVGEYDYCEGKSSDGVLVRVYTPVGKKEQGKFSCDVAVKVLPFYKNYFNVAYPLSKLDLIAIPDFASGAMENWGLVTYRETALLVDAKNTSTSSKQWIALIVSHELAHQWFGNLVTMEWWTHLWLNEGFATWIEFLCVDHLFPHFDIWTQFVTETLVPALNLDALRNSHPIEVPVGHPSEVDEIFDNISYNKGASVIRMLHSFIGDEDFRKGMNHYLTKYQYSNTITEDLWASLEHASGKPVAEVMNTWTKQMGFPLIKVAARHEGTSRILTLTQEKFCADNKPEGNSSQWMVPINLSSSRQPNQVAEKFLLDSKSAEVVIEHVSPEDWVKVNMGAIGYYRVQYPTEILASFLPAIRDQTLPPLDRISLHDDLFALVQCGQSSTVDVLKLMEAFVNETNYNVWNCINDTAGHLSVLLSHTPHLNSFRAFGRRLFGPVSQLVGWDPKANEGHMDALLRSLVLMRLALFRDPAVIAEAKRRFDEHVSGVHTLPADLRAPVYRAVLSQGDENTLATMLKLYKDNELHEERNRISRALGSLPTPALLQRVLDFAMSDNVRTQDKVFVIISVALNNDGRDLTWEFFKKNVDKISELYGGGFLITALVKHLTENFASEEKAREVEKFFTEHKLAGAERSVQQSVEKIRLNADWLNRDEEKIGQWLNVNTWQPRWFILDNGILAYYKSQEEVNQGCKGSINLTACEIAVHPTDNTRLDLIIPSEQHFYLKAPTPQERQQWLVALGSAKACLNRRKKKHGIEENPDALKSKKSEVRLYCDLLMQQVHTIKMAATQSETPDIERLNEATSLLSATCDTFIKSLEECVKLANANFTYELPHQHITDSALPALPPLTNVATKKISKSGTNFHTNSSESSCIQVQNIHDSSRSFSCSDISANSITFYEEKEGMDENCSEDQHTTRVPTFFSILQVSFISVVPDERQFIPTKIFLEACRSLTSIFDILGSTTFLPVKLDLNGNINKLYKKYEKNVDGFSTIQELIHSEIDSKTTRSSNSATDALLWLKRGLAFIFEILNIFLSGEQNFTTCGFMAYDKTLKPYHGWVLRGAFALASKALPYRKDFITCLALSNKQIERSIIEEQVFSDCKYFYKNNQVFVAILFTECSKVGQLLQNAVITLMETKPENPIEYLALHYEWEPEKTTHVRQAAQLLTQLHYSHKEFIYKVHKAYLIVSQCPAQQGLKGLTGDVQMDLLRLLTKGCPEREVLRLMERLYCRATEVVPFSVFRSSAITCLIFQEYVKEVTELYKLLDLSGEGQARRSVCDTLLTRLWNACLRNSNNEGDGKAEARTILSNESDFREILQKHRENDKKISFETFLSQSMDIFLMKITNQ
uniref:Pleckstrin homology domain-containing family A member 8 n=1 Tax=Strigamia maritima TaxID=126957 RepID=T1J5J3_STRMM